MTAPRRDSGTAAARGGAVGASVAALAVAAHGAAGGGFPDSTDGALVLLAAILAGAAVAAVPSGPLAVFGLLAGGQFAAHAVLSGVVGHAHAATPGAGASGGWMLLAHTVATLACGGLVLLAQRLYEVVSGVIRTVTTRPHHGRIATARSPADPGAILRHTSPTGAIGPRAPPVPAR